MMSVAAGEDLSRPQFDAVLTAAAEQRQAQNDRLARLSGARRVIVYTYGVKGKDLALQLREAGVECLIYDNGEASRTKASEDGFQVVRTLDPDLPLIIAAGQNQLEITATLDRESFGLAEALWAFDLRNSYGPARRFSEVVTEQADAFWAQYQAIDAEYRGAFLAVLKFRVSLDVRHLGEFRRPVGEMWQAPITALGIRSFCDVGAYDGDTLITMKAAFPTLERTFTVEPNAELIPAIERAAQTQGLSNTNFCGVAWERRTHLAAEHMFNGCFHIRESESGDIAADTLDAMTGGEVYDYVKFDVEGSETEAILGGRNLLRRSRCISVAAYHLPSDLVDLPSLLRRVLGDKPGWRCAFQHYSQSFDDSIFYVYR